MSADTRDTPNQNRDAPRWWSVIATLLAVAVFSEAIFAGAMLSGIPWAHTAHSLNAKILVATATIASLVGVMTLRRLPHRGKLMSISLCFAVGVLLQAAIGTLSAKGINLLWIHIPLGVALFGIAGYAAIV
jgi:hypothetical protein